MKPKKNKILRYLAFVLAALFLISAGLLALDIWEKRNSLFPEKQLSATDAVVEYNGSKYSRKDNIETWLIMGLDKYEGTGIEGSYNNDKQADFMLLLVFDNANKTCEALHINRDTMAEMNILGVAGDVVNTITKQIALSHTYGNGKEVSCRNAANAVSKLLLGAPIDHYVSVTMDAVPKVADYVGGVEVEVLDDFTGIDDSLIKGEKVTLRGQQALTYVRTRFGLEDSSNATRMNRQAQFLKALYSKFGQCVAGDDQFVAKMFLQISEYVVSDSNSARLQTLMEKFSTYKLGEIRKLEGETLLGGTYMEFYPTEASIKQNVVDLFYRLED